MTILKTSGLFNSPEELIDQVWRMESRDSPIDSIKRMCGVSESTVSKILNEFEPSIEIQIDILDSKIFKGQNNGQNVDYLIEKKSKLENKEDVSPAPEKTKVKRPNNRRRSGNRI